MKLGEPGKCVCVCACLHTRQAPFVVLQGWDPRPRIQAICVPRERPSKREVSSKGLKAQIEPSGAPTYPLTKQTSMFSEASLKK